ncbi:histidine ammonia-lyase [Rathayibacter sp. VKM Ac-2803]|uniref:aromatic amino acid lyase n=1 Tax=unclassified Rathayibacter TaxID=2609250 RepID=UPI00135C538E|nr:MULTISPECIES: aromatic amino acid lyase [unclassified Rathayibacter]MWV48563.1 histidine ammonia-lyase [Rathayibacter sp. VKM Ac-2803]MWV60099.1 histidine ammonia-lyase [Rathayibacter sp. VKM Ac-2754]
MIALDGTAGIGDIVALADRRDRPALGPGALDAVADAARAADRVAEHTPVYGRSTGVGANRATAVSSDSGHALRLLRSHAVDAGPALPARAVRAMLAVRLNQLCLPGSGIAPEIVTGLLRMLEADALPEVRALGSIGTGDLTALAGAALALLGERPTSSPLPPMAPWGAGSALAFVSSNALTIGRACLAVDELARLDRAARVVFALSAVALGAEPGALSIRAAEAAAAPGVVAVAEEVGGLLAGVADSGLLGARVQDPYGLRVFPHTQGALAAARDALADRVSGLVRAGQENPLFHAGSVVHHGGFFQAALALAAESALLALAGTTATTLSRIRLLNEPEYTGARPFLATGPAGSSGLMMVEYVAASAIAEIRSSAQPASLGTVSLSRGTEDDAPFASQAVAQLERALPAYRVLLASELLGAGRALRQRERTAGHTGALGLAVAVVGTLPVDDSDRDLRPDLERAGAALEELAALIGDRG